jgi:hypothetical protein
MLGRWPNTPLYTFPRMSKDDTTIWLRWLNVYGKNFDRFDYDLPVGNGEDPGPDYDPLMRKDFMDLTKKRIDAVGYIGNTATIFEIKPRAGTTALGQLISYKSLFQQTYPTVPVVSCAVITELMTTEEQLIYKANKISVIII